MSIAIDKLTTKEFSQHLSYRDRIRLVLDEYGEKEVYLTTEQIASKVGLSVLTTYQAMYGLERAGEIELLRESSGDKDKIIGVKLIKLEVPEVIHERTVDKAILSTESRFQSKMLGKLPALVTYLQQKLAVEEAREALLKGGLSTDAIQFEENPLGEEAIFLLQKLSDLTATLNEIRFAKDAAERNYEFLKNKQGEPVGDPS